MFKAKPSKPQTRIDSLIGAGTSIAGDIGFSGGLRIDGIVKGAVTATAGEAGTLVLSEKARVEGDVRVSHLVVNGMVQGAVYASEFLELQPHAHVVGDVHYSALEMHLGAVVEGRLIHHGAESESPIVSSELDLATAS